MHPIEAPAPNLPARYSTGSEPQGTAASMPDYLWSVRRHFWKILLFAGLCAAAALWISAAMTPLYESTATVDVDRVAPAGVLGQEAVRPAVSDADQFLATQVKLIESDAVLRPVARRYGLAGAWKDAPLRLEDLRISRPPNTYLLRIGYRSPRARLSADVANGIARSYMDQTYALRFQASAALAAFMEKQLGELKGKMELSSAALARFERELGVLNPGERTGILSARLLQLNTEYTNAEIDRVRKEGAWQSVAGGTLEAAQVSTQGDALKRLLERLDEVRQKFTEVKAHYGANHPEYRKASAQVDEVERQLRQARENAARRVEVEYRESVRREAALGKAVAAGKAEFDRLNARSFQYQALKQEAEGDKKLYDDLLRKIREAGINAGFENSAIRIADAARPAGEPVSPKTGLNVVLALLFAGLLASALAVARESVHHSVRDSRQIAAMFQTDVMGVLPDARPWNRRLPPPLDMRGGFEAAVGSLRNAILLGQWDRPLKSLMITSAAPAEGKTTAAVHLAVAHARRQRKTLLIDADLRRPSVAGRLGIDPGGGLAEALHNGFLWRKELIRIAQLPDLDVLPAGAADAQAADLLGARLAQILRDAADSYELIVIDAPPVLAFPEPLEMAAAADGVVMLTRAGTTSCAALGSALDALGRVRAPVLGIVLNQTQARMRLLSR